jgi:hypothetical protein
MGSGGQERKGDDFREVQEMIDPAIMKNLTT